MGGGEGKTPHPHLPAPPPPPSHPPPCLPFRCLHGDMHSSVFLCAFKEWERWSNERRRKNDHTPNANTFLSPSPFEYAQHGMTCTRSAISIPTHGEEPLICYLLSRPTRLSLSLSLSLTRTLSLTSLLSHPHTHAHRTANAHHRSNKCLRNNTISAKGRGSRQARVLKPLQNPHPAPK